MAPRRINLTAIDASLREVQSDFARINRTLSVPRDPMTDEVRTNMMAGYRYLDEALAQELDFFALGNLRALLELNTLVLCGTDEDKRKHFARHIAITEQRFYEKESPGIGALMEWLQRYNGDDVWTRAAGAYIHVLSRPQLYVEGNHRAGALIISHMLAREGRPPFVLSVANAMAYFDPSSLVKGTNRHSLDRLIRIPKLKKRLAGILRQQADERYLIAAA